MQENEIYTYKVELPGNKETIINDVWSAFVADDGSLRFTSQQGLIIAAFVAGAWVSTGKVSKE